MNLREFYSEINEDYNDVMAHLPREASVIKFLRMFAKNQEFSKMIAAFEEKDYKELFATSHNVKGMCANLSLKHFSAAVSDICEEVREGEPKVDLTSMVEAAQTEYAALIAAIDLLED